jgi:hypothetical protein
MFPCASGLLLSALSLSLVLADLYHGRINYIPEHAVLGGILCILFFTMCHYGYEMINWIVLLIIPIYVFVSWVFTISSFTTYKDEDNECEQCSKPVKTCGCPRQTRGDRENRKDNVKQDYPMPKTEGCPAKPMKFGTLCGISRFT